MSKISKKVRIWQIKTKWSSVKSFHRDNPPALPKSYSAGVGVNEIMIHSLAKILRIISVRALTVVWEWAGDILTGSSGCLTDGRSSIRHKGLNFGTF